jgi:hypothetical protein
MFAVAADQDPVEIDVSVGSAPVLDYSARCFVIYFERDGKRLTTQRSPRETADRLDFPAHLLTVFPGLAEVREPSRQPRARASD